MWDPRRIALGLTRSWVRSTLRNVLLSSIFLGSLLISQRALGQAPVQVKKPPALELQTEVAKSVIAQMGGQIDLLITLALGICGGLTAFLTQITLHNRDDSKRPVTFKGGALLFGSLFCEGASIIFGYLSRGAITSLTPKLFFAVEYFKIDNWTDAHFDGSGSLRTFPALQGVSFILGILLAVVFFVINGRILRSAEHHEATETDKRPSPRNPPKPRHQH